MTFSSGENGTKKERGKCEEISANNTLCRNFLS